MNNKAPEEIYLRSWAPGSRMEVFSERCYKTDIKYIRAEMIETQNNSIKEDFPYPPAVLAYIKARIEDFEFALKDSGDDVGLGYAIKILKSDLDMFCDVLSK